MVVPDAFVREQEVALEEDHTRVKVKVWFGESVMVAWLLMRRETVGGGVVVGGVVQVLLVVTHAPQVGPGQEEVRT